MAKKPICNVMQTRMWGERITEKQYREQIRPMLEAKLREQKAAEAEKKEMQRKQAIREHEVRMMELEARLHHL